MAWSELFWSFHSSPSINLLTVCQRATGIYDPERPAYENVILAMWDVAAVVVERLGLKITSAHPVIHYPVCLLGVAS
jgi:hypothetical protein